ncbi:MAG: biotin/lipoyl-containing protein [Limisphaerales bacterium]
MIRKLRVTVDGKSYDVTVEMDDEPSPARGTAPWPVAAPVPHVAPLPVSGASTGSSSSATTSAGPGDIPSPLAGRVTAIGVETGQEVKEGDHLLTLEAMKMNTFVMAPRAGKVSEIKVSVGSAVEEGQALIALA